MNSNRNRGMGRRKVVEEALSSGFGQPVRLSQRRGRKGINGQKARGRERGHPTPGLQGGRHRLHLHRNLEYSTDLLRTTTVLFIRTSLMWATIIP